MLGLLGVSVTERLRREGVVAWTGPNDDEIVEVSS
jgi:hypothetical protein